MAYLTVDGYDFPPPKRGVTPTVVTMVDGARNANAAMVGQKIGRDQYKFDNLVFPWLSAEQWSEMLQVLDKFYVMVTFPDPVTNTKKTLKMYPGNRTAQPYWIDEDGNPTWYRDCKVNLIDCGE